MMIYRFRMWIKKLRSDWEIKRFKYPCIGCLLLQTCEDRCDKIDMALVSYINDRYPGMCAYCGGSVLNTGETEWWHGCKPPALSSIYRCNGCRYKHSVSGPGW